MAKPIKTIGNNEINSLDLAGYNAARGLDAVAASARYIVDTRPQAASEPEVQKQVEAGLKPGIMRRFFENQGEDKAACIAAIEMPKVDFGKLKETDPIKHKAVATARKKAQDYVSKVTGRIMTAVKSIAAGNDGKARAVNKTPAEWIESEVATAHKKAINWASKGSITKAQKTKIEEWLAAGNALAASIK